MRYADHLEPDAVNNDIDSQFRIKSYTEMLSKYGSDSAVKSAAGRTNPAFNAVGANLVTGSVFIKATCECAK
jgi:hypothetical protein